MILQGLLDEPMFALYLSDIYVDDSEIVFDSTNEDRHHSDVGNLPRRKGPHGSVDLDMIS